MSYSKLLFVISLFFLLFIVYSTMNSNNTYDDDDECSEGFAGMVQGVKKMWKSNVEKFGMSKSEAKPMSMTMTKPTTTTKPMMPMMPTRETFVDTPPSAPVVEQVSTPAVLNTTSKNEDVKVLAAQREIDYTTSAKASEDVDINDIYTKVEGTDLLTAPLADRFLYTNSIANVNRNASQDFRGDIPIQYDSKLAYFNNSSIYGEPLTINRLGDISDDKKTMKINEDDMEVKSNYYSFTS